MHFFGIDEGLNAAVKTPEVISAHFLEDTTIDIKPQHPTSELAGTVVVRAKHGRSFNLNVSTIPARNDAARRFHAALSEVLGIEPTPAQEVLAERCNQQARELADAAARNLELTKRLSELEGELNSARRLKDAAVHDRDEAWAAIDKLKAVLSEFA